MIPIPIDSEDRKAQTQLIVMKIVVQNKSRHKYSPTKFDLVEPFMSVVLS